MTRAILATLFGALWVTRLMAAEPGSGSMAAGNLLQEADITGSVRAGYWTSSRSLNNQENLGTGALWLRAAPKFNQNTWLVVDGWAGNERGFRGNSAQGVMREGYFHLSAGAMDVQIGKQIIAWGRADQLNPTDNLSPKDYTLLVPDDSDQRSGVASAKATYFFQDYSITGIWLAGFRPNVLPFPQSTSALAFHEHAPDDPDRQGAIKIGQSGGSVDWSLSYFSGLDLNPDLGIDYATPTGITVGLNNHRIRVFGGDAATTLGSYGLRAEVAYTSTENPSGTDPEIKSPFFYGVAGIDCTFSQGIYANLQYFVRTVSNYHDPTLISDPIVRSVAIEQAVINNEFDRTQQGITLRISDAWLNDTLAGEIAYVATLNRYSYLLRPKLTYSFSDQWKGILGADIFRGDDNTFLGRLRGNSTAYVELRYGF